MFMVFGAAAYRHIPHSAVLVVHIIRRLSPTSPSIPTPHPPYIHIHTQCILLQLYVVLLQFNLLCQATGECPSVASSQSELIERTRWTPCGDLCSGTLPLSIVGILCLHFVYNPFRMPPAAARLRHNGGSSLRLYSGAWATDPIHISLPVSIIFLTSVAFIVLAWLLFLFHLLLFSLYVFVYSTIILAARYLRVARLRGNFNGAYV